MSVTVTKSNTGLGCSFLFCAPFLLGGLAALAKGVITLLQSPGFTEEVVAMLGVGSVFTLVGGGLMGVLLFGHRQENKLRGYQGQYPNEPWLWREDWALGRVLSATPAGVFVYWLFGLVFGSVGVLLLFKMDEITQKGILGYTVLLFPLAGGGMLVAAIYTTLRWFKYGRTYCDLLSNPGMLGGWFRAVVWVNVDVQATAQVQTLLTCFHCYVSGSGKHRTAHRNVRWQESLVIDPAYLATERDGRVAVPIKFYIPYDCAPTTPGSPTDRIEWELSVKADVPGIDLLTEFIVPVFLTEESSERPPDAANRLEGTVPSATFRPTILLSEGVNFLELYAPPRRNLSTVFSITLFTIIWTAIIVGMLYSGEVPLFFPVVFGFFDLLLLSAAIWLWFGEARIRIQHGKAKISRTVFGLGSRIEIPLDTVTGVDAHITMQSGSTPFYTIRLKTLTGKRRTVGGIGDKNEVNALIERIESMLPKCQ